MTSLSFLLFLYIFPSTYRSLKLFPSLTFLLFSSSFFSLVVNFFFCFYILSSFLSYSVFFSFSLFSYAAISALMFTKIHTANFYQKNLGLKTKAKDEEKTGIKKRIPLILILTNQAENNGKIRQQIELFFQTKWPPNLKEA